MIRPLCLRLRCHFLHAFSPSVAARPSYLLLPHTHFHDYSHATSPPRSPSLLRFPLLFPRPGSLALASGPVFSRSLFSSPLFLLRLNLRYFLVP